MLHMKEWFHYYGYPLSPWIFWCVGICFGVSTKWENGKKARAWLAGFAWMLGTVVLLFQL